MTRICTDWLGSISIWLLYLTPPHIVSVDLLGICRKRQYLWTKMNFHAMMQFLASTNSGNCGEKWQFSAGVNEKKKRNNNFQLHLFDDGVDIARSCWLVMNDVEVEESDVNPLSIPSLYQPGTVRPSTIGLLMRNRKTSERVFFKVESFVQRSKSSDSSSCRPTWVKMLEM